nr:MAG TPA: hypothetical protein [Caudoviricetes sp.]DAU01125.1 MAG TPA: hypothetical protein [Caudoviricetes sp.]DAZ66238.1 MAG TPA: hypothetical protein [Caudoviricetes sp.]
MGYCGSRCQSSFLLHLFPVARAVNVCQKHSGDYLKKGYGGGWYIRS